MARETSFRTLQKHLCFIGSLNGSQLLGPRKLVSPPLTPTQALGPPGDFLLSLEEIGNLKTKRQISWEPIQAGDKNFSQRHLERARPIYEVSCKPISYPPM